jgi:cell division protein FtsB
METLAALLAVFIGLFFYEKGKRNAAESLNTNIQTKEDVQKEQAKIDKVDAQISVEEAKQKQLQDEAANLAVKVANEELTKFFNDRSTDKQ